MTPDERRLRSEQENSASDVTLRAQRGHASEQYEPAVTPEPPYTAVIFTSVRTATGEQDYASASAEMERLAAIQPGYLGIESARTPSGLGITVSYWRCVADARAWKQVAEHRITQRRGREDWYRSYWVRVATVEREYGSD